ncbi:MAG: hypothetical protein NTV04_20435 [Deltaproteobacteria bacterium]|nr:hypothetical protein [Deltaproteobacteria bacterium]
MRKLLHLSILGIALTLWLTSCSTFSYYKITHKEYDSLENPFVTDSVVFYFVYAPLIHDSDKITATKYTFDNGESFFTIEVSFMGDDWRFMDGDVLIRTDHRLYRFKDDEPYHKVLSGGTVHEVLEVDVQAKVLLDMISSGAVRLQYWGEPVDVTPEGLAALSDFCSQFVLGGEE